MYRLLTPGASPPHLPVLARAAAAVLLKSNVIRYNAVSAAPFSLDFAALKATSLAFRRLIDIAADTIYALDPDDVRAATILDADLTRAVATRLHLPRQSQDPARLITLAWCASHLNNQPGFALFDDRWGDTEGITPPHCLTNWRTVLEVMHMNDYADARTRFALAAALRPIHNEVDVG